LFFAFCDYQFQLMPLLCQPTLSGHEKMLSEFLKHEQVFRSLTKNKKISFLDIEIIQNCSQYRGQKGKRKKKTIM